jgi:hypothetical protein
MSAFSPPPLVVVAFAAGSPTLLALPGVGALNRLSGLVVAATLPPAVEGETCAVEVIDLGDIVVTADGADTVNGGATYTIPGATDPVRSVVAFICDAPGQWTVGGIRTLPTFDCLANESILITHSAPSLAAGATDVWSGQDAAAGFDGGGVEFIAGTRGAAAQQDGSFVVNLGSENGAGFTGRFRLVSSTLPLERLWFTGTSGTIAIQSVTVSWGIVGTLQLATTGAQEHICASIYILRTGSVNFWTDLSGVQYELGKLSTPITIAAAAATVIDNFSLSDNTTNIVEFNSTIANVTSGWGACFIRRALIDVVGGVATIIGAVQDEFTENTNEPGWTCTITVFGADARMVLTTDDADTVRPNTIVKVTPRSLL